MLRLGLHMRKHGERYQSPLGLKLVAKYEPLHLYIYADNAKTNKHTAYLIREGNDDLVYSENTESNTIETEYFEKDHPVLRTERDKSGKYLRRVVSYFDDSGGLEYTYIDEHGDGLWDVFMDDKSRHMFYVRSNLCWVLRYQDINQLQGNDGHSNNSTN